jgi:regulator of PEP synthase PpsR (kinase-PPPase family)
MTEYTDRLSHLTKEELIARREALLNNLGMSYKQFVSKEMNNGLKEYELEYAKEIDAIDFILEEDKE